GRSWKSAAVNDGGLLRSRLPGRSYSPCPLQVIVHARGAANQDRQGRMLNRAVWQHAQEEAPPLLTDAAFAAFVELDRRGTGHPVNPKRVELKRKAEATKVYEAYFK